MNFFNKDTKSVLENNSNAIDLRNQLLKRNQMIKDLETSIVVLINQIRKDTIYSESNITKSVIDDENMKLLKESQDKILSDIKDELKKIRNTTKKI